MPKLGVVQPESAPIDPFKNQPPPTLGVVPSAQVTVPAPQEAPKIGVLNKRPSQVVSVAPPPEATIGMVAPAYTPEPAPVEGPPPVGVAKDEAPVYPTPPPLVKPNLGAVVDLSVTPAAPPSDETIGVQPAASQPVVVDPFKVD